MDLGSVLSLRACLLLKQAWQRQVYGERSMYLSRKPALSISKAALRKARSD